MCRTRMRRILVALALVCLSSSCGEEVVVRVTTRIYRDGGVTRRVEISGRDADGSLPVEEGWLVERARVQLADREAWNRVMEMPARIVAEGFFQSVEVLPPVIAHRTDVGVIADRERARLEAEDLVVLRHWTYREIHGDPYGPAEIGAALDGLIALAEQAMSEEIRLHFGGRVDPAPAVSFLRKEGRALFWDLLPTYREAKLQPESEAARHVRAGILSHHGVPVSGDVDHFEAISLWLRDNVATSLSTAEYPLQPEELTFWPVGEHAEVKTQEVAQRVWGSEEEMSRRIEPLLSALTGYYGDEAGQRLRFEPRLVLPGQLLRTNGTVDLEGVVWVFRDEDLTLGEIVLEAESVELDDDALRAIGARRQMEPAQLLQLTDLLARRDPDGNLRELLAAAVRQSSFAPLRDEDEIHDSSEHLARELVAILDPAVEPPPPLL